MSNKNPDKGGVRWTLSKPPSVSFDPESPVPETEEELRRQLFPANGEPLEGAKAFGIFERWNARLELEKCKRRYGAGDAGALMVAMHLCFTWALPIPEWLKGAFNSAYAQVNNFDVGSWDDVFGRPHPKGAHLARLKRDAHLAREVHAEVVRRQSEGAPTDTLLFEEVGEKFAIGKSKAAEFYYEVERRLAEF